MPSHYKIKIRLLAIFYQSTLTLAICFAVMASAFVFMGPLNITLRVFAIAFMTGGTALSLLYKEMTLQHEYYFYYNQAISKTALLLTCILINTFIALTLIIASLYV